MPRGHPWTHCRGCHKKRDAARTLSRTGLCLECVERRIKANGIQLRLKAGPYYERQRAGIARRFNLAVLDERSDAA